MSPRGPAKRRAARVLGIATWFIMASLAVTGCGSSGSHATSSTQSSATSRGQTGASSANALIGAGIMQANAKQYQQAETTFHDVLVIDPANKYAWYNLGLIAQEQNQASKAIADYTRAISIDARYTPAMYNQAILLERTDLHAALSMYQRITSINSKAATAFLREGWVYDRLGEKAQGAKSHARAVALDARLAAVRPPASG
ncbi:MAG: tetratricopeptide repeat protein [Solirubrobacterales bacterium]|nr:tetratricopeptide repeat protein [Solirubrobacterales bacterium]MBV9682061.1 tetratricopeptide repeat protein [Solirubrobacterales bacterium]